MEKKERMALEMQLSVLKTSCENVPFKKKTMEMQIGKQDEKDEKNSCVFVPTRRHITALSKQPHFRPYKTL